MKRTKWRGRQGGSKSCCLVIDCRAPGLLQRGVCAQPATLSQGLSCSCVTQWLGLESPEGLTGLPSLSTSGTSMLPQIPVFQKSSMDLFRGGSGVREECAQTHDLRQRLQGFLWPVCGCPGTSFSLCLAAQVIKASPGSDGGELGTDIWLEEWHACPTGKEPMMPSVTFLHCLPSWHSSRSFSMHSCIHSLPGYPKLPYSSAVGQIPGSCHPVRYRYNSLDTTSWVWFLWKWRPWAKDSSVSALCIPKPLWWYMASVTAVNTPVRKEGGGAHSHWSNSEI